MKFEEVNGKVALVFDEMPAFVFVSKDGVDAEVSVGGNDLPVMGSVRIDAYAGGYPVRVEVTENIKVPIKTLWGDQRQSVRGRKQWH